MEPFNETHPKSLQELAEKEALEGRGISVSFASFPVDALAIGVRLRNAIQNAKCSTIGAFLALGKAHRAKLRNYGRHSEAELGKLLRALLAKDPSAVLVPLEEAEGSGAESILTPPELPSFASLANHPKCWPLLNPRSWEVLRSRLKGQEDIKIEDVATHIGSRWPTRKKTETVGYFLAYEFTSVRSIKRMGRVKLSTLARVLVYLAENPAYGKDGLTGFDQILESPHLKGLSKIETEILQVRLMKPESAQETLEEISRRFHITRERVRQVEASLLKGLREAKLGERIRELLHQKKENIFRALSNGELCLKENTLHSRSKDVSGPMLLAVYVEVPTLHAWLDKHFRKVNEAWVLLGDAEFKDISTKLCSLPVSRLPLPSIAIEREFDVTDQQLRAWLVVTGKGNYYAGYVLSKNDARQRRAATAHKIAVEKELFAQPYSSLLEHWPESAGYSKALERLISIAVRSTPSLFIASSSVFLPLIAVKGTTEAATSIEPVGASDESVSAAEIDARNDSRTIEVIDAWIKSRGPMNSADLKQLRASWPSDLPVANSSIGVFLTQTRSAFLRLAPGLYERIKSYPDPGRISQARHKLEAEGQVIKYCLAVWAGENPQTLYPLWDPVQEYHWLVWGEHTLEPYVFESLLHIAKPDGWTNVPLEEKERWRTQSSLSRWRIPLRGFSMPPRTRPTVSDVAIVGRAASVRGSMSWVRANHLIGGHINERTGHTAMVLATALGFLAPSRSQWRSTGPAENTHEVWAEWERFLSANHWATWENPWVIQRLELARDEAAKNKLGWITPPELSLLLDAEIQQETDNADLSEDADDAFRI